MSTLVLRIPSRQRVRSRPSDATAAEPVRAQDDYDYVITPDGIDVEAHGHCAAALLPRAATVVAVLADTDVGWHRIAMPRAPAARLRAALGGLLEEALLEDDEATHLALAPGATGGQPTWVAALDRQWLRGELALLQRARVFVDRVVPMVWPDEPASGHFSIAEGAEATDAVSLTWAHQNGVANLRLQGGLARALVPMPPPPTTRWSASPSAAMTAEQWLGAPVTVMPLEQRLLQAARSLWNLRQFELAPRTRGARALRNSIRRLMSPEWRPVRIGAVALVLAQIVGLNLWAWHQRGAIDARRATLQDLVKASFPRVGEQDIRRDAGAVMQRETQALRALAGKPGEADLEPMLQAAASAWPPDRPVENFRFEPGRLSLAAIGWNDAQIEQFRNALRPGGWRVDAGEGRVTLSRARSGTAS
ncbi:MAG: type II secretion system protein GspL [Caldimonas sp.]